MQFPSDAPVTPRKLSELRERLARVGVDLKLIEETFIRGGGKGGQKRNKTANCVQLRYPLLDLVVRCQRERRRSINRFLALRELVDEAEWKLTPETSERARERDRLRRKKARGGRRGDGGEVAEGGGGLERPADAS